ncbi:hypothetical protein FF38_13214 [Lucilia cuprina]|uniref:Uncharacterized protein n=1 Tax=Lucilia cuprina TaxID=7375 RepID=A0A0L0CJT5_LUCCU|nr:hypothetical protein FF38_13214 [Lucilia cuprina]
MSKACCGIIMPPGPDIVVTPGPDPSGLLAPPTDRPCKLPEPPPTLPPIIPPGPAPPPPPPATPPTIPCCIGIPLGPNIVLVPVGPNMGETPPDEGGSGLYKNKLTGPGCNLKPANCTADKGNNSLPTMGGLSITLLGVLPSDIVAFSVPDESCRETTGERPPCGEDFGE